MFNIRVVEISHHQIYRFEDDSQRYFRSGYETYIPSFFQDIFFHRSLLPCIPLPLGKLLHSVLPMATKTTDWTSHYLLTHVGQIKAPLTYSSVGRGHDCCLRERLTPLLAFERITAFRLFPVEFRCLLVRNHLRHCDFSHASWGLQKNCLLLTAVVRGVRTHNRGIVGSSPTRKNFTIKTPLMR